MNVIIPKLAVLTLAVSAAAANAVPVRYGFSGLVNSSGVSGVAAGTVFSGEFWWDTLTPPLPVPAAGLNSCGTPTGTGTECFYRTGGISISAGTLRIATVQAAIVNIVDKVYDGFDSFSVQPVEPVFVGGTDLPFLNGFVAGNDETGQSFSSAALPASLGSRFVVDMGLAYGVTGGDQYAVDGRVTELHQVPAVPEPSSYSFVLAGLSAVSLFASRRRRRSRLNLR